MLNKQIQRDGGVTIVQWLLGAGEQRHQPVN
ncbi:hypothetical protein FHS77_001991 [Paenochrobactrum gallinarii]|uniref:Uncharacterized protein n=1 Tax=Paenochrobactrum gallinarii TaxID=643673 RepID=A0A841LVT2_9HYPH|nr:hypothetical protein [Paenochrobactrum gallinarii]